MHNEEFRIFNIRRYSFVGTILLHIWKWTLKGTSNIQTIIKLIHILKKKNIFLLACHFVTDAITCLLLYTSNWYIFASFFIFKKYSLQKKECMLQKPFLRSLAIFIFSKMYPFWIYIFILIRIIGRAVAFNLKHYN